MNPYHFFQQEEQASRDRAASLASQVRKLSILRIVLFAIFLIAFVWFANNRMGWAMTFTLATFPLLFGMVVRRFNKITAQGDYYQTLSSRYSDELSRLDYSLESLEGGDEFINREHAYAYDLDLFGAHSLFKLLNRTATVDGRKHLAEWMIELPGPEEIAQRQEAVKELSADPAWVVYLLSKGHVSPDLKKNTGNLKRWLAENTEPRQGFPNYLALFLTALLLGILAGVIWMGWPLYALLLPAILNGVVLKKLQAPLLELNKQTSGNVKVLRGYEEMIKHLQQRKFTAPMLQSLHAPFEEEAVGSIQTLRKLLDFMDGRANMFYAMLDVVFLLDVYLLNALENWKRRNKKDVSHWFDHIAKLECLGSLGLHAYAHPNDTFPTIARELSWRGNSVGHPLIQESERVENDFVLDGSHKIAIITGSNMSGKSTFLRTVGINTVLAYMGSVVAARSFSLSRFQLFTAMRTEDDLKYHISSFYAELRRIQALLQSVNEETTTLCLLDEILKGTNTEDRHRGAKGLLNQLNTKNVAGLVSTHDLELGRWGERNNFANYSFNSRIEGEEIHFNYKISEGVCHSFNASQLMKNMGIELPPEND